MRTPKNLLVTGGAGFIGSAFIRYLFRGEGFTGRVVNLDALTYAGNLKNLDGAVDLERYVFVRGSIGDQARVERLCREHRIDTVVNFAAESHVDRSIVGPGDFIETNIVGTFALLEVVRRLGGIHFHHVSTDEVYGSLGKTGKFLETTAYAPKSPYSASKAASDHLVRAYANTYGLSMTLSNCSNNYGPYQFPEKLIPLMISNCLEHKPLPVYGDGSNVRDWLYVDDHAEALWRIVQEGAQGETYNIGGNCEVANIEVVRHVIQAVAELAKKDEAALQGLITYVKDRPGHDWRYAIDCSKLERELGWKPRHTFDQGLRETVRWYLHNEAWLTSVKSGEYRKWIETNYAPERVAAAP